ncbi:MAG: hypothetical protein ACYC2X_07680 [Coriobacteriia bacterium]
MRVRRRSALAGLTVAVSVVLVLINSGYMLSVASGPSAAYIQRLTLAFGAVAFAILLGLMVSRRVKPDRAFLYLTFFIVLGLASAVANGESLASYVSLAALLVTSYVISISSDKETFIRVFGTTMVAVVAVSFVANAFIAAYGLPTPLSMVSTPMGTTSHYNYLIFFYPSLWPGILVRNQGLFWEPGLFASFLILALVLEIHYRSVPRLLKIVVLVAGVLSTSSTSGILMLPLVAVLMVDRWVDRPAARVAWGLGLFGLFFLFWVFGAELMGWLQAVNPTVFGKILAEELTTSTRFNAPLLNLRIFSEHPFLGAGFHGANREFTNLKVWYSADSQTSTVTYFLAAWGIGGVAYTVWWLRSIVGMRTGTLPGKLTVGLTMMALLNAEPHGALMATWVLFFAFTRWASARGHLGSPASTAPSNPMAEAVSSVPMLERRSSTTSDVEAS